MAKWKNFEWKHQISMKIPLVILILLAGFLPMLLQGKVLIGSFRQNQIDDRIIEVQNQCLILSNKMTRGGYMASGAGDELLDGEMDTVADIFNGRIIIVDKNFRVIKDTFGLANQKMYISEDVIKCFMGENSNRHNKEKHYFALTVPIYDNTTEKNISGVMAVTASTENILDLADRIAEKGSFFQMIVFWILVLASMGAALFLLRPFQRLQRRLDRIADGNLEEELPADSYKETAGISSAVERTLTKLKAVDQSRQEFVSNVSHELKTPITSIRVLADSLMGMEEVPIELYREFMTDISDEIDRESKIIDDLLSLVRMDKAATEMNIAQVNINALLELILKRLRPIAKKRNIELILESIRDVTADADETKLSLALNNLVENAIKYNVEDGWVRVTLDADHKFFYVKVADSGIGIPEEYQDRIFERFYRVDKARSRETGGTGLGLAITKSVVLMHQGALKLQSKEGEGTTFTVRIPLSYIS
ncbi:two-component sensor histidine kinase [Clostridium sp. chh4-2]|uniref:sensor histidine kinase n=1 Tax=Clostridium sp. chh4-2 TaxID=2067550 RepID=UPI000CCF2394|nr:HAMP domain-containing sensor histidine kinase [Clostridium sp. chh4-2]PNV60317.1 two-component sensor histidine kinase [Clostridium sp. chh4-2]